MKLSKFKQHLELVSQLNFIQENKGFIPSHFHVTEAGLTVKHFFDCGGTLHLERAVSFQLWFSHDKDYRLEPHTLKNFIALSENLWGKEDLDVEFEYQTETIGRYDLEFDGQNFLLVAKQTNCLAVGQCGTEEKQKAESSELQTSQAPRCTPNSGCC